MILMYIIIIILEIIKLFGSITIMYMAYISYLIHIQTATAIWSGNFLGFYNICGRQLVRHSQKDNLVLFLKLLIFSRVNYSEDEKCSAEQDTNLFCFVLVL